MIDPDAYDRVKYAAYAMVTAYLHDDLATLAVLVDTADEPAYTISVLVALVGVMHTARVEDGGGGLADVTRTWAAFLLDEAADV